MARSAHDLNGDWEQANQQLGYSASRLEPKRLNGANYLVREQIHQAQSNQQVQRLLAQLQSEPQPDGANSSTSHAVARNEFWGAKLGWNAQSESIVTYLQQLGVLPPLQSPGPELFAEGVQKYQDQHGLGDDGILGPNTWRHFRSRLNGQPKPTSDQSQTTGKEGRNDSRRLARLERIMARIYREHGEFLQRKSSELGIGVADAAAFLKVESGGEGFSRQTDLIKIRFENHVFYRLWGKNNLAEFQKHFRFNAQKHWRGHRFRADSSSKFENVHSSQEREQEVLAFARTLDDELALQSISMGSAQILGTNYALAGYESASEMFEDMSESIDAQNEGLFSYIKRRRKGIIIRALQAKDYVVAARYYNGRGKEVLYGGRIKAASEAYQRILAKQNLFK